MATLSLSVCGSLEAVEVQGSSLDRLEFAITALSAVNLESSPRYTIDHTQLSRTDRRANEHRVALTIVHVKPAGTSGSARTAAISYPRSHTRYVWVQNTWDLRLLPNNSRRKIRLHLLFLILCGLNKRKPTGRCILSYLPKCTIC